MSRSVQDLLAERRENVLEQSHSDDPMTRRMLQAHIDYIDQLIADRDEEDEHSAHSRERAFDLSDPEER